MAHRALGFRLDHIRVYRGLGFRVYHIRVYTGVFSLGSRADHIRVYRGLGVDFGTPCFCYAGELGRYFLHCGAVSGFRWYTSHVLGSNSWDSFNLRGWI